MMSMIRPSAAAAIGKQYGPIGLPAPRPSYHSISGSEHCDCMSLVVRIAPHSMVGELPSRPFVASSAPRRGTRPRAPLPTYSGGIRVGHLVVLQVSRFATLLLVEVRPLAPLPPDGGEDPEKRLPVLQASHFATLFPLAVPKIELHRLGDRSKLASRRTRCSRFPRTTVPDVVGRTW